MIKGFDVSSWQDNNNTPQKIDWTKAKAQESKFCYIRAAYATKEDEDFKYNWQGSKGLLRGAYQFYDYRISAEKQAEYLVDLMGDDWGELPPAIDVEQPFEFKKVDGVWKSTLVPFPPSDAWTRSILAWISIVEPACGKKPVIYSGPNIIRYGLKMGMYSPLIKYPLWIANYQNPPVKPNIWPWQDWVFWQWGTPPVGLMYGMESKELDCNLFNGTIEELNTFAGTTPMPEQLTLEQRVERLEKLHDL